MFNEIKIIRPSYLLHMDPMGLMRTESKGSKRYVLVVMDDFSRYSFLLELFSIMEWLKEIIKCYKKWLRGRENLGKFDAKSNVVIFLESIGDNLKDVETTKDNFIDIPERNIDPNMDEVRPLDDTPEETKNKHKPRIPKNHLISDIIGDDAWTIALQEELNQFTRNDE
ncbi:hypothetical protein CK203_084435 [Vitis vinifera]|uniref:Retrovirus-related Pol polyprotein from transposon TNT 1-94 n=1 Tax=Vitis vinifera TaxID=29760 RepID=A0A438EMZ8_VITVI|nr:hypothetical protein CK203_084435 [Vitis vinifera]